MKKHILLIDADEVEMKFFLKALDRTHIPYKCTWAKNSEQALSTLAYLKPDIIFLDLGLVDTHSLDAPVALKRAPQAQAVPLVLYSPAMSDEFKTQGMALGAAACLVRPPTVSDFADALGRLVNSKAGTMTS
jgi:DNA-binding response OmpR family regulator